MATIHKTYCDHCGKEIDAMKDYQDLDIDISCKYFPSCDLCAECFDELTSVIIAFIGKKESEDGR